jgi:hypothetical protein
MGKARKKIEATPHPNREGTNVNPNIRITMNHDMYRSGDMVPSTSTVEPQGDSNVYTVKTVTNAGETLVDIAVNPQTDVLPAVFQRDAEAAGFVIRTKSGYETAVSNIRNSAKVDERNSIRENIIGYAENAGWERSDLNALLEECGMDPKTNKFDVVVEYGSICLEFTVDADEAGIDADEYSVERYVEENLDVTANVTIEWSMDGDYESDSTDEDDTSWVNDNWSISVTAAE